MGRRKMNPYAQGARTIAEMRATGKRPAGPVIVALNGDPGWDNATVIAELGLQYRWDWVKGLPSIVVTIGAKTRLGTLLADIEASEPGQLDVIDTERQLGWMVLFAKRRLVTVTWPKAQVIDWLGDGVWHDGLNKIKASFGQVTA